MLHRKNLKILLSFGLLTVILISLYVTYVTLLPPPFYETIPTNSTLGFSHIYVINLAHRADRRHRMEAIASFHGLDFDFFTAISKDDDKTLSEYKTNGPDPSHKACYVSHYKVWELIAHHGYESTLILEDDVDFEMNISQIMSKIHSEVPADWEMLYLGHCTDEGNILFTIQNWLDNSLIKLFKSKIPACTHAYAVTSLGVSKLLREIINIEFPIDVELVHEVEAGNITSYSVQPSIIVQRKNFDDLSDVSPGTMGKMWPLNNSTLHYLGLTS